MDPLVLYCKSYRTDAFRVRRLAESIAKHNKQEIPFYISVPDDDLSIFTETLGNLNVILISDESILRANTAFKPEQFQDLSGGLIQQIVKSEFWRLGVSENYLCLDSDAVFIRDFYKEEFLNPSGTPYTVIGEAHDLFELALQRRKGQLLENFNREAALVQNIFGRTGRAYSFGPMPMVWSRLVWESLDLQYLRPRGLTFVDAIKTAPLESRWYGEALFAYSPLPIVPCEPFFKVYHYAWQFDKDRRAGVTPEKLSQIYSGIIYQSAWEREMDWPAEGGGFLSRAGRRLRRWAGRI